MRLAIWVALLTIAIALWRSAGASGHGGFFAEQVAERRAIVTSIVTEDYVLAARVLGYSLQRTFSDVGAQLVAFVEKPNRHVSEASVALLQGEGWRVIELEPVASPSDKVPVRFQRNFIKLRLWSLVEYETIVYLDADMLVLRNIAELFALPRFAAAGDVWLNPGRDCGVGLARTFNAGAMVIKPNLAEYARLLASYGNTSLYDVRMAEQGFLNYFYNTSVIKLPLAFNMNLGIKALDMLAWDALMPHAAIIHYTMYKPFEHFWNVPAMLTTPYADEILLWERARDALTGRPSLAIQALAGILFTLLAVWHGLAASVRRQRGNSTN